MYFRLASYNLDGSRQELFQVCRVFRDAATRLPTWNPEYSGPTKGQHRMTMMLDDVKNRRAFVPDISMFEHPLRSSAPHVAGLVVVSRDPAQPIGNLFYRWHAMYSGGTEMRVIRLPCCRAHRQEQ